MKFINLKSKAEETFIYHPTVLCLGNFDGVHIGHRQLVAAVLDKQKELKSKYPDWDERNLVYRSYYEK